jgi:RNA polymerase sigma-70 factor (ECF subfamily)
MAYNLCKNEYRHQEVVEAYKAEHQLRDEPASSQGEGYLNTELMYEHLRKAIATLPTEQRTAFTLRYQEELPVKEIAHILQVPEGTIKSRLHYALLKVQEAMKPFK